MEQEFMEDVKPKSNGISIAALILGILSVLCCCVGFPFAIVGIILAVIALVKHRGAKPAAIIGLILSILCMAISIFTAARILPYKDDIVDFAKNAEEYVEEYEESGEMPPLIERMKKDGSISEDIANDMMDKFVESYKASKGETDSSSDANLSSKTNR